MKGLIFVNAYKVPKESVHFAERLQTEFSALGVNTETIYSGYTENLVKDGRIESGISCDFAVFLDKDKYLSACLEKSGVRLFNSHNAIRTCDDKGETFIALSGKGLNLPDTLFAPVCYNKDLPLNENGLKIVASKLGYPIIIKESFGSMGKGVYKADDFNGLKTVSEKLKTVPHVYQKYLPYKSGTDVRMIVIGGKFLCAMMRENKNDFRSNIALGGVGTAFTPSREFIAAAEKCANVLGLDYCGVDLLFGKDSEPYVCEVNSNAFITEIERVTGVNVAKNYAEYIVRNV